MRNEQRDADRHEEGDDQRQRGDEHGTEQQRTHIGPEVAGLAAGEVGNGLAIGLLVTTDQRPGAEQQEHGDGGEHHEYQDAAGVGDAFEHLICGLASDRFGRFDL